MNPSTRKSHKKIMLLEVVERLCNVTAELVKIVDEQAVIIEQAEIVDSIVKDELRSAREAARKEFENVTAKYCERK